MVTEYVGLVGLVGLGLGAVLMVSVVASRLRGGGGSEVASDSGSSDRERSPRPGPTTSRYFTLAVVGTMLHAGSFFFYLWGASVRSAGLVGLWVMLALGFCLIVGVFYAWALGAVSYSMPAGTTTESTSRAE